MLLTPGQAAAAAARWQGHERPRPPLLPATCTRDFRRVSLPGHGRRGWTVPPRNPRTPCYKNQSRRHPPRLLCVAPPSSIPDRATPRRRRPLPRPATPPSRPRLVLGTAPRTLPLRRAPSATPSSSRTAATSSPWSAPSPPPRRRRPQRRSRSRSPMVTATSPSTSPRSHRCHAPSPLRRRELHRLSSRAPTPSPTIAE